MTPDRSGLPAYLFVLPWSPQHVGGVNQVVLNLAKEMKRHQSFRPIILVTDWSATLPVWDVVDGIEMVRWRVHALAQSMGVKARMALAIWLAAFRSKIKRFIDDHNIAVVNPHFAGGNAVPLCRLIQKLDPRVAIIMSFHGSDLTRIRAAGPKWISVWWDLLKGIDATVVCSNDLAKRVTDTFSGDVTPVVIHNGVNSASFQSAAREKSPWNGRYILSIGTFEDQKGHDVLVKAFASIAGDYEDLCLLMLGATASRLPDLRAMCEAENLSGRVHFFPDTPHVEVATFCKHASVFALPSRQEAFGIVLLEAGCFSLPVVASRVGGIPDIITDRQTGLLVRPDAPEELAQALRIVLDDQALALAMGRRLNAVVTSRFTWEAAHNQYLTLARGTP